MRLFISKIIASLIILFALFICLGAPHTAYAAGHTIELDSGITVAYDASNSDELKRTVVGSGNENRIQVSNAAGDDSVAITGFLAGSKGASMLIVCLSLISAVAISAIMLRRKNASHKCETMLDGVGHIAPLSHRIIISAGIVGFALVGGLVIAVWSGIASQSFNLTISNTVSESFANTEHAFPVNSPTTWTAHRP